MKRALIDPTTGMIAHLAAEMGEFPVASPYVWVDVPDTALALKGMRHADGTVTNAIAVKEVSSATVKFGSVMATLYAFSAGEGLPEHVHADHGHSTQVIRGQVRADRAGMATMLNAGDQTAFAINEPHALIALTDALIVSITDSGAAA